MSQPCVTEVSGGLIKAHNLILQVKSKSTWPKNNADDVLRDHLELSTRFSTPGNKRICSGIPLGLRLLEHGVWL